MTANVTGNYQLIFNLFMNIIERAVCRVSSDDLSPQEPVLLFHVAAEEQMSKSAGP